MGEHLPFNIIVQTLDIPAQYISLSTHHSLEEENAERKPYIYFSGYYLLPPKLKVPENNNNNK